MATPINTGKSLDQLTDDFINQNGAQGLVANGVQTSAPAFDLNAYFERKLGGADIVATKREQVAAASKSKADELMAFRNQLASQTAAFQQQQEAQANSWAGRLGLEQDSAAGTVVNQAASLASGASRQVVGALAALPTTLGAGAREFQASQEDLDSYNRYLTGVPTAQDMERLNRKVQQPSAVDAKSGMTAINPNSPTVVSLLNTAQAARSTSRKITNTFDISSIVDQTNRQELDASLGENFKSSIDNIGSGWDQAKKGQYTSALVDVSKGIGGLLANTGEAAITNPKAVSEYVMENIPQLFVGALGKVGSAVMTTSNIGYAADYYNQGIEQYQKTHEGQLPSKDEMAKIGAWAASLALAEQLGDKVTLGSVLGKEAVGQGIKNTAKAAVRSGVGETLTEGYQGYAEEVTTGRRKADDFSTDALFNIYQNAVIGGLSGSVMGGGGRAVGELTRTTEQHAEQRAETQADKERFAEAAKSNDVTQYLNQDSEYYDPSKAVGALFAHNQFAETNEATRKANLIQASNIADNIEEQLKIQREALQNADKSNKPTIQGKINELEKHATQVEVLFDGIANQQEEAAPVTKETVQEQVQAVQENTEQAPEAADTVINLSMRNTENLTQEDAQALASNGDNGLSPQQREYLNAYANTRQTDSELTNMGKVSQEVYYGSKANVGIAQYRSRVANAIAAGNQQMASRQVDLLTTFADNHASKATAAAQAVAQGGLGSQIVPTENGWKVSPVQLSPRALKAQGGMVINSARLVRDMQVEAQALQNAKQEISSIVALKFAKDGTILSVSQKQDNLPPNNNSVEKRLKGEEQPVETNVSTAEPNTKTQSEVSEQQDEAQAKSPVVEDTTTEVGHPAFQEKTPEGESKPYQKRNLVADYFTQRLGKEGGSNRPLVATKDFIASIKGDVSKVLEFTKSQNMTEQQDTMLRHFTKTAISWFSNIDENMPKDQNSDFRYSDMSQFLMTNGKFDENTKTAIAYAAYSWLAENASRSLYNTDEEINTILNRDEDALVSSEAQDLLRSVGTRQNVIVNSLGQRTLQALGLNAMPNAPMNLQADLTASIGAHVMKLLLDQGLMTRNSIEGKVFAELTGSKDTSQFATQSFLSVAQLDGDIAPEIKEIQSAMKGTEGMLDKLFGAEEGMKDPSNTKIPFTQQSPRNTDQKVPSTERTILKHENGVPSKVRLDLWNLAGQLHMDNFLAMAGFESINTDTTHIVNQKSIQAKNDGLLREYINMMDYFGVRESQDRLEEPMFFDHVAWKQQRVGIATNTINPQTSKIHRHMLFRPNWETEVNLNDQSMMENFKLRVAEGLGIKTDKQDNEKSLADVAAAVNQPAIKQAIAVLRKSITEGGLTLDEQKQLVEGVQAAGEAMQSLDALMAMAHYLEAVKEGKSSFTSQLMSEVDGVTNGPMLSHLLMGAAPDVNTLYKLLNRGGFYTVQSGDTNYNLWRSKAGSYDLYETTAAHMIDNLKEQGEDQQVMNAIWTFTGTLANDDKQSVKERRNIIKTPLTAMIFGSAVEGAVDSMADNFVKSVYAKMEDAAVGKVEMKQVIQSLNVLGLNFKEDASIKDMMNTEFTKEEIGILKNVFTQTIGEAVKTTMKADFATFIEQRRSFNVSAQLAFDLYNSIYTGLREERIAQLVAEGKIETNKKTGKPMHDLTRAQETALRKEIESVLPIMHTAFSQQSNELSGGILASKTANKISTDPMYQNQVKFGKPFPDGPSSVKVAGLQRQETAPGVAMAPMSVHSLDSFISHIALMMNDAVTQALNVHDAHGSGLKHFQETAQNLNKATFQAMMEYSPASQMADMLGRVITGVAQLQDAGRLNEATQRQLQQVIASYAKALKVDAKAVLDVQMHSALDLAFRADDMKLAALAQMGSVDQYALQGGNYQVTDKDRADAQKARQALDQSLETSVKEALSTLSVLASGRVKEAVLPVDVQDQNMQDVQVHKESRLQASGPYNSPWGDLGAPHMESNQALVDEFNATPVMNGTQAIRALRSAMSTQPVTRSSQFVARLLNLVEKTMPDNLTVQMITPATPRSEVLAQGAEKSRGWYVAKGGQNQINLLSPDFKYSGLTPEVLAHELVHATLAQTVQAELDAKAANPEYKSEALDLVNELESLRSKAEEFVSKSKLNEFKPALENVHEFMAWGMTNLDFQRKVLNQISMTSNTKGNALVTGMKKFITTLVNLLFKDSTKTDRQIEESGMAVMIANVSGLYYAAAQTKSKADLVLNAINNGQPNINAYSTMDIFDGLVNTNTPISATFQIQLKGLLQGIVDQLHGPYGSFKESLMQNKALTPAEVFAEAMVSGQAPFASKIMASGFRISEQEAYVIEQVEAVMRSSLNDNASHTTAGYQQLAKLYKEAQEKIKPEMFHKGVWANATQAEKDEAQAKHDFLFKIEQNQDGTSDYLARFAALVLAHEDTANLMSFATDVRTKRDLAGLSLFEKLHEAYDAILGWLNGQFTKTFEGQAADEKLTTLVKNLVDIEAKKTMKIGQQRNQTLEYLDNLAYTGSKKARDKIEEFGKSAFFKLSTNGYVRALGSTTAAVAGGRVNLIMDGIMKLRDEHFRESHGLVAGIINEIRGAKDDNIRFHQLLRMSKKIEGTRKDIITNTTKFIGESFEGEVSREEKAAISAGVLRTDAASLLDHHSVKDVINLLVDDKARATEIGKLVGQLGNAQSFGHYWIKQAKLLGFYKAQGRVAGANLMFNAGNIAKLYGTQYASRVNDQTVTRVTPLIDQLVSLYAIEYQTSINKANLKSVVDRESSRTDGGNGIEMVMKLHKALQKDSKDRLFASGDALYMKGYLPESFNPYIELKAADELQGEELEKQGFVQGPQLNQDDADPDHTKKHLYVLRDGGLQAHLTGVFSYTGRQAKGTKTADGLFGQQKSDYMKDVGDFKAKQIQRDLKADPSFDPRMVGGSFLAPVLNPNGDVVNYRYMMTETIKDTLLERNNDMDKLLGILAGNIYDKEMTVEQNGKAIKALKAQYDEEFAERHHSYLKVGKDSPDPKLREIWQLLPASTKQTIKEVWGGDNMMVRVDLLDINFGYRKLSISDTFNKDEAERNAFERVLYEMGTFLFGEKARLRFKQSEDIWQALVREAKDTMVIKSGITLLGNISSNLTELFWFGVSPVDVIRHHRVAMKGALAYRKDMENLERINLQLNTGYLPQSTVADLTREKAILEDALKRNPVTELIDAGMMPTIVEDVAGDDDEYSFKGRFQRKVDDFTNRLNPHIVNTAKTLLIARDTPLYKALSYGTQLSDFVARYTLYKHVTERKRDPMQKEEALQLISDAFINYDVPSHRLLQYANDMGFVYFTKYALRIQNIIVKLYRDNPGRALQLLTFSHFFDGVPTLMDSAAIHRIGNPFSTGAIKYVSTLDDMATINAMMTPFK